MNGAVDLLRAARERGVEGDAIVLVAGTEGLPAPSAASTWTLADLEDAVEHRAEQLVADGVQPRRIHPVVLEPDDAGVRTLLALWRLGATPAPLNPRLTDREKHDAVASLEGREAEGAQVVLWTSGTAGRPRGVALSWAALAAHVDAASRHLGLDPARDAWLASLSLAHIGGLMVVVRALLTGSRLVALGTVGPEVIPGLLTGVLLPAGAADRPVTHASLVPTQLLRLLDVTGDAPPPGTFRCLLLGGAQTPRALLDRALAAGWPVALTYGMTEMSSQVATALPEHVRAKPGTVGRTLPGVELRIAEDGEILVRGPARASAYLDGTSVSDGEGWYRTGDLGRLDEAGDLWVTGRRSDRIVSGGVNVDAAEVEEVLRGHPAVADACVAGIADEEWGEVVAACVVPVAGEFDLDEVDGWLRERLSGPKRPRKWRFEAALPLNASGKVDRAAVRALLSAPPEHA